MMIGGGWLIGLIVLILVLLLIGGAAVVAVLFIGQGSRDGSQAVGQELHGEDEALEVLRRRYAAGEIDREEFQRMREELSG